MATGIVLSTAARNAACNAIVDLLDAGSGAATITIRDSGTTTLAELTMSDPAFGASDTGTATAAAITPDASANASGTPYDALFKDSDATTVLTIGCGVSGGSISFPAAITAGVEVQITSLTVTVPAGSLT